MKRADLIYILKLFVAWRLVLFVVAIMSFKIIPIREGFLGGSSKYFTNPLFWSHMNFDGEHYLSIAYQGYRSLEYFFFPLYPVIVGMINNIFSGNYIYLAITGLLVSHISLLLALIGIFKITVLHLNEEVAKKTIVLILLFPTSFFFVNFYTESLFLALVVWSFYFFYTKRYFASVFLAGLSTASRIIGVAIAPALLAEGLIVRKKEMVVKTLLLSIASLVGITLYMIYLYDKTGDPLEFFHSVSIFGQQRSSTLVPLPQVFYRYIFKIFPSLPLNYFPVLLTSFLEFSVALFLLLMIPLGYRHIPIGLFTYSVFAYLIPTLSGSFSSLPRYAQVIFPVFMISAYLINNTHKAVQLTVYLLLFVLLTVTAAYFYTGYFVS